MYGLRRLQIGRCGELAERLSSRPTVARVVTREYRRGRGTLQRKVGKRLPEGATQAARRSGSEFAKRMSSGDARRRHRRSRLAPERGCHEVTGVEKARLCSKRRGPGICPAQGHRRMACLKSAHQSTGAVAGLCTGKVGKRLPQGAARAARRSVSEMSQTSKQRRRPAEACRSRHAPERGCHEVTGLRKRACAASAGVSGICPV